MSKAKVHKSSSEFVKNVELPGKAVRYIGMGEKVFTCPTCGRSFARGMLVEHNRKYFCSRGCLTD